MNRLFPKKRLSKTALKMYKDGRYTDLDNYLLGEQGFQTTVNMAYGKAVHRLLELEFEDKVKPHLREYKKVELEQKHEFDYSDDITLVGIVDLLVTYKDGEVELIDYKTGKTPLIKTEYELNFYAFLLEQMGVDVNILRAWRVDYDLQLQETAIFEKNQAIIDEVESDIDALSQYCDTLVF